MAARLIGLIAATAIALAVAGCGGAGHHSAGGQSADQSAGHHSASHSTTTSAPTASYPATFVARSTDTKAPGIAIFSTRSGQRLRRLTDNPRDIDPLLTRDRGWVYFVRVRQDPCPVQLERVPAAGGTAQRLAPAGYPGGPVAISPDGRMLAYISTGTSCRLAASADTLVLANLATGQVHRIAAIAWGWRGRRTTVRWRSSSPTFDARGVLFYTAMISHEPGERCWLSPCHDWSYALVSRPDGRTRLLSTQRPSGDAVLGAGVVNADGSAMIYRLPFRGGHRVWRWSAAGHAAVPPPGAGAGQPVWR